MGLGYVVHTCVLCVIHRPETKLNKKLYKKKVIEKTLVTSEN